VSRRPFQKPKDAGRADAGTRVVPGPTVREKGGTLPCGCKVDLDEHSKTRFFFCSPHAVAYELLEAVKAGLAVLDDLVNDPPDDYDVTDAMDAAMKARRVIKKAKGDWA
jgi:hypothetical protein